jgi:hypothetical protein
LNRNTSRLIRWMQRFPLLFQPLLNRRFARELGFNSLDELVEGSFQIFIIPPDGAWYATRKPDGTWVVWSDEGLPPHPFEVFPDWEEAIRFLKSVFDAGGYPEECWAPVGFDDEDDEFRIPPDKRKI